MDKKSERQTKERNTKKIKHTQSLIYNNEHVKKKIVNAEIKR